MTALIVTKLAEVSVELSPDILNRRESAISTAKTITAIGGQWELEDAVTCLKSLQSLSKLAESSRTEVKAPVLELGRTIDGKAKEFSQPIDAEVQRINRLVTAYQSEQQRKAQESERARQAELKRIEDEQRKAVEAQAKLKRDAEEAEAARIRAEADSVTFNEADEAKAKADAIAAEAKRNEAAAAAQAETKRLADLQVEKSRAQMQVAPVSRASGLITKDVWKFEVLDVHAVYAANKVLCRLEVNTSAVNDLIRAGLRECPGLRIWSETKTEVR